MADISYQIDHIPIKKLQKNPDNPRLIKGHQFRSLCKSLEESPELFEARPILAVPENGHFTILGGNMRFEAAKKVKMASVPVIIMKGLTKAQKRAIAIKDNGAWGEWDFDLLSSQWSDLPLSDWGINLPDDWLTQKPEIIEDEPQIDRAAELQKEWGTAPGQIWRLGQHRLMCGDGTKREDVDALMDGVKPNLMVTDPPYGVEYNANWRNEAAAKGLIGQKRSTRAIGKVNNDDRADWREAWALFTGNIAYVWHAGNKAHIVAESLLACGFDLRAQIVWNKNNFAISRGHYHPKHEPCWYAVRSGSNGDWHGDRFQTTVWDIPKNQKSETGHSTQKPVQCMFRPIINNSSEGQAVYDPFLGSGTTLIACEQTNRICYGMEIDPAYVAVTLQRWKDFTEKDPNLVINEK
jgi:DNA modification methylase